MKGERWREVGRVEQGAELAAQAKVGEHDLAGLQLQLALFLPRDAVFQPLRVRCGRGGEVRGFRLSGVLRIGEPGLGVAVPRLNVRAGRSGANGGEDTRHHLANAGGFALRMIWYKPCEKGVV